MSLVFALIIVCFAFFASSVLLCKWMRSRGNHEQYHCFKSAADEWDSRAGVVIVGGGILGASMATVLARGGRKVTLIERDMSEPDRIVGELLQPGGYEALVKLGLKDALVGTDCHTVRGYVIHDCDSNASVKLSYPLNKDGLIQTGRSFHHGRFVMGLRRLALNEPNVTVIEGTAQALFEGNSGAVIGVQYKDKNTGKIKTVRANFTVVADGCFSKFRKDLVSSSVVVNSNFVGIIMHDVPQCESGHAEIVLGDGGPILVYQISSTCTRILVDVPNKLPSNLKEYLIEHTSPQLPEYIRGPFLKAIEEDRLRSMPNSFLPPVPHSKKGVVILGDAFNMRHPLTGAGMSTALNDVLLLSKLLRDIPYLDQHDMVQSALKSFYWKRKLTHSFVINILAQALYALFSSPGGHMNDLRRACFEYFKLGSIATSGPIGLLSVLKPYPSVLIGHFFAVAFFAIYRTIRDNLIRLRPDAAIYKSIMIFYNACITIFPLIFSEIEYLFFS